MSNTTIFPLLGVEKAIYGDVALVADALAHAEVLGVDVGAVTDAYYAIDTGNGERLKKVWGEYLEAREKGREGDAHHAQQELSLILRNTDPAKWLKIVEKVEGIGQTTAASMFTPPQRTLARLRTVLNREVSDANAIPPSVIARTFLRQYFGDSIDDESVQLMQKALSRGIITIK